jgi:choice-of-anchor A domain-containing protein
MRSVLVSILALAAVRGHASIDLGGAQNFAVFQTGGSSKNWNTSDAFVQGDVGIAFAPNISLGNLAVNGNVYSAYAKSQFDLSAIRNWTDAPLGQNPTRLSTFANTITYSDPTLTTIASKVETAEDALAGYAADFTLGDVTGSQTIHLSTKIPNQAGIYVISVGKLALNNGQVLMLDGQGIPAGANVVVNVSGQLALNGGSIRLENGLHASQVLVNDTSSQAASITGGGILFGTFMGDDLNAMFNNNGAAIYGSVIAGSIQFASDFRVYATGNEFVPVPEPATFAAGVLLLLPIGARSVRTILRRRSV